MDLDLDSWNSWGTVISEGASEREDEIQCKVSRSRMWVSDRHTSEVTLSSPLKPRPPKTTKWALPSPPQPCKTPCVSTNGGAGTKTAEWKYRG